MQGTKGRTPANANASNNPPSTRNSVGKSARLGDIKIPQLACLPNPWQVGFPVRTVCTCMQRIERASVEPAQLHIRVPLRCSRSISLQPQHTIQLVPERPALVARHSGPCRRMRVNELSLHRGIFRPVCRLDLDSIFALELW
jgi:hypothetical protein